MSDELIITVYLVIDELMKSLGHVDHPLVQIGDAEVLTVAVVAAKYFQNHHERALWVMVKTNDLSGNLSISHFNRRLHQLAPWLG